MDQREGVGGGPQRVWRLVCAVTEEGVRAESALQVEMTLPPSDPLEDQAVSVGFSVEVRDADEQTLYRRVMTDPFETTIEVPGEPGDPSFTRHPAAPPSGFTILVPALPDADHVSLIRGEPSPARGGAKARPAEVGRLPLAGENAAGRTTTEE
jgi:hypothetical protein